MGTCLASVVVFTAALAGAGPVKTFSPTFESQADLAPQGKVDKLVFGSMRRLSIRPANLCSDAVFVRRVYLDTIGTLPTADEARRFLGDQSPKKRQRTGGPLVGAEGVRRLLGHEMERPAADQGRVSHQPLAQRGAGLSPLDSRRAIRENQPYDRFVRELLTASGSNFRVPPVNFYRAMQSREPQAIAQAVALTFMGDAGREVAQGAAGRHGRLLRPDRLQVARPNGRKRSSSSIPARPGHGCRPRSFPTGRRPAVARQDPREVFADWLIAPQNPWFARNIVNRVWYWLLGRGIVHEPDDIRARQPAAESRAAGLSGAGAGRLPLRPEARLPPDPELENVSAFFDSANRAAKGRGAFRLLSAAAAGGGGADRRPLPDHGNDGKIHQRHSRAVHVHPRRSALDRPGRRQHQQLVPGAVRASAARHGPGIGTQQSAQPRERCTC